MGIFIQTKIEGREDLDRRLSSLGDPKLVRKIMRKALRAGGKIILRLARQYAPSRTGLLRRSLGIRVGKVKNNQPGYEAVIIGTTKKRFQGKSFYAWFQEFGWHQGSRKGAQMRKKLGLNDNRRVHDGKHYLERAMRDGHVEAEGAVKQSLMEQIDEAMSKKAATAQK